MKQDENEQNKKEDPTPVVDNKPNGKSQLTPMADKNSEAIGNSGGATPASRPQARREQDGKTLKGTVVSVRITSKPNQEFKMQARIIRDCDMFGRVITFWKTNSADIPTGSKGVRTLFWTICILVARLMTQDTLANVTLNTLKTFKFDTNGFVLRGGLTLGNDGNFYGTTIMGGVGDKGTIFRISPDGSFISLFLFTNYSTTGAMPMGTLLQAADGDLYGTTISGGTNNSRGTLFKMTLGGSFSSLASLTNTTYGGLTQTPDGNIYGVTIGGSVFRISTNGTLATIGLLGNAALAYAGLLQGNDGNFYGTSAAGGDYGLGMIFQVTTNGVVTTMASFNGTNGSSPQAGLIQGKDGYFYGTTAYGGTNSNGTIFQMSLQGLTGTIASLVSFRQTNGAMPMAKLIQAADGNFYGTTGIGGASNNGTIFQLTPNGKLTTLYSFPGGTNGYQPWTELTENVNGDLYGTTGGTGGPGTIFVFNLNWPVILLQPLSQTNVSGSTASFSIFASSPNAMSYQWQRNGTNLNNVGNLSGVNTSNLIVSAVSAMDAGIYTVIVSNSFHTIRSAGAGLTLATIPVINVAPVSQTNFYGWTSSFAVSASGIPYPTFRWQKNGTNLTDNSHISGTKTAMLMLRAISYADAATYFVIVSNIVGIVTNTGVILVVTNELVQNGSFESGDTSGWTLSGDASGSGATAIFFVHSGLYSAWLSNHGPAFGHLSQSIPTTPGATYLLSFWLNIANAFTPNELQVAWNTNSTSTNIISDLVNIIPTAWTNLQFIVTATETMTTLDFGFLVGFSIDDVVVLPVMPANSPPPQLSKLNFAPNSGAQFQTSVNAGNS